LRELVPTPAIRILVIENHVPLADLLVEILQQEKGLLVGVIRDLGAVAKQLLDDEPQIVIVDENLPGQYGLAAIRFILDTLPSTRVILLNDQDDHRYLDAAHRSGAIACVRKDLVATDLVPAVKEIMGHYSSVT
jgi:DNA-binding NarL/FixJ family response regulator